MLRTFDTHKIRKQRELTNCLWDFSPLQGEYAGKIYKVSTPCCWENHPDFGRYKGEGDYTTTFYAKGNIRLEFKGVSHTATVFLDGEEIAHHYNAYTAFDAIVKDVGEGEHTLTIRADNRFSEASALHIVNDYYSYGGVSRPVALEELEDVYIQRIHVTPFLEDNTWKAKTEVFVKNISNHIVEFDISATVNRKNPAEKHVENILVGQVMEWKHRVLEAGEEACFTTVESFEGVQPWMPKTPDLYYIEAVLTSADTREPLDDYIDRFGFREVTVQGKDILMNGEKLIIKGLCRHEDHPQFGCALPYAAMTADLEIIKHLGANSVRTSHYPNDEIFLDLCDEQGILVWEENHARGLSLEDMQNPNFEPQAEEVIREMIRDHYNHPAIYIWGILNECASDVEYGRECYAKQFKLIKELDTSRPHSFASFKFKTDICFDLPDVVSYNIYPLWYHDTPVEEYIDDLYQWVQKETGGAGKPFLITEIGAGGLYGYRNAYNSKWTEEYQAEALKKQLTGVLNYADCSGVYIWQFCDVRVCEEWAEKRPRSMNNKGIVDEYRRRKLAYDVVKRIFEEK